MLKKRYFEKRDLNAMFKYYNEKYFNNRIDPNTTVLYDRSKTKEDYTAFCWLKDGKIRIILDPIYRHASFYDVRDTLLHEMIHALQYTLELNGEGTAYTSETHGSYFKTWLTKLNNKNVHVSISLIGTQRDRINNISKTFYVYYPEENVGYFIDYLNYQTCVNLENNGWKIFYLSGAKIKDKEVKSDNVSTKITTDIKSIQFKKPFKTFPYNIYNTPAYFRFISPDLVSYATKEDWRNLVKI